MNKQKALMKRAEWLAYCLEIGWTKDELPELEKAWDRFRDEYGNLRPAAGHSHKGEGWVRVEKFREMAEALDKPVLNMLKKQNIGFDKWSENIHRLVEKELGFRKISVYEPLPQPPKTDKP